MDGPNPELMHLYGTDVYYLEKTGQLPAVVRALAGAAGFGLYAKDKAHQEKLLAEAEEMNRQIRVVEQQRMSGVTAGFEGRLPPVRSQPLPLPEVSTAGLLKGGSALDSGAEKVAEDLGRSLAEGMYKRARAKGDEEALALLEKLASGVELTGMEKEAVFGALFGAAAKGIGKGLGALGKKVGWGATGNIGRGGGMQAVGGLLRKAGLGMRKGGRTMQQKGVLGGRKVLGWKGKAALGLGATGLGYTGYKGLQTARDYMMIPSHGGRQWGAYGMPVRHSVNPRGYVNPYG